MSWLSDIANGGAQQAATAQEIGLLAGMQGAESYLNQNPGIITGYGGNALSSINQGYGGGFNTLGSALPTLSSDYGNALSSLGQGYGGAYSTIGQGTGQAVQTLGGGLPAYQQIYGSGQQGSNALSNLLGLNGPAGAQSALAQLKTTPGYQFQLGQGNGAINAAAAANGTLNSGNQLTALSNYDSGLAGTTYQNAVSNLSPYLGLLQSGAGGIAGVTGAQAGAQQFGANSQANALTGLGLGQASTLQGLGNAQTGVLGSQAGLQAAQGTGQANIYGGESSALTGNNNILAQLLQQTYTGIGNAQGSADLAQGAGNQALLSGALKLGSSLLGGVGGLSGITSGLSGLGNALSGLSFGT